MVTGNTEATYVAKEFQICSGASSLPTLVTVNFLSQWLTSTINGNRKKLLF